MNTSSLENSSNLELITASELRDVIRKAADPNHDAAVLASQYLDALRARPALCATKCLELFHKCLKDKTRFHEQDLNVVFYILNSFQICLRKLENADVDEKDTDIATTTEFNCDIDIHIELYLILFINM